LILLQILPDSCSKEEDRKVKTAIIALAAAALIAAAPAVLAQGVPSKSPGPQHKVSKKHHSGGFGYAPRRQMQAKGSKKGYPAAFGYAPGASGLDRETEMSRQAGGGSGM
jgi:hypothetical protein